MPYVEIERKWLLNAFPDMPALSEEFMEQGYLCFAPTVRIRRVGAGETAAFWLTVKGKGTLLRTEVELPLTAGEYGALTPLLAGPAAAKRLRRYALPDGLILECSHVDEGEPGAFFYAEVEFNSEEAARAFKPPAFLGREVTAEPGYTMAAYCRKKTARAAAPAQAPPPGKGEQP